MSPNNKYLVYLSREERELLQRDRGSEAQKLLAERKGMSPNLAFNMIRRAKREMERIGQEHEVHLVGVNKYYMCLGEELCCFCKQEEFHAAVEGAMTVEPVDTFCNKLQETIKKRKKGAFWS